MRSKIKLSGDCNADIQMLIRECKTNNQICYHIGKNQNIIKYLEAMTGLNGPVMVLFYHYKEGIKDIPKCICGKDRQYHCYGYRPTCGDRKCQSEVREISKKATCMEKYGVEFHWNTAISQISYPEVFSGKRSWQADEVFVCSASFFV